MPSIADITGKLVLVDNFTGRLDTAANRLADAGRKMESTGRRMSEIGGNLTRSLTVPITAIAGLSLKAAVDFESSFTGVRKTVNATNEEFAKLSGELREMAKTIPVNVNQLNQIAEMAGQLGIETQNIAGFTRTIADLGATTNLSFDQAATQLARFINITGSGQDAVGELGSVIVGLGNATATTESEILDFGLRIAAAGKIAGLSEDQILAIGASMSSVGVQAEAGGTAVQKVLISLRQAVVQGGDDLETFARAAQMSANEFKAAYEKDAGEAFRLFVEGLKTQGDAAFQTLDDLGLGNERVIRSFLSLAEAGDKLEKMFAQAKKDREEDIALADEAAKRYETFASQLTILWNRVKDIAISFGTALMPVMRDVLDVVESLLPKIEAMVNSFTSMPPLTQRVVIGVAALAAAAGPLLIVVGGLVTAWGGLMTMAPALGTAVAGLAGPFGVVAIAIAAVTTALTVMINKWRSSMQEAIDEIVLASDEIENAGRKISVALSSGMQVSAQDIATLRTGIGQLTAEIKELEHQKSLISAQDALVDKDELDKLNKYNKDIRELQERIKRYELTLRRVKETGAEVVETTEDQADAADDLAAEIERLLGGGTGGGLPRLSEQQRELAESISSQVEAMEAQAEAARQGEGAMTIFNAAVELGIPAAEAMDETWRDIIVTYIQAKEAAEVLTQAHKELNAEIVGELPAQTSVEQQMNLASGEFMTGAIKQMDRFDDSLLNVIVHTETFENQAGAAAQSWGAAAQQIGAQLSQAFGGANSSAGNFINQAAGLFQGGANFAGSVQQFNQQQAAAGNAGSMFSSFNAGGMMGGGGGFGYQLGSYFGKDQEITQYGGRTTGNFGKEGAMVGSMIGSAFGPWGELIGGVLGGALGSMIKKGADDAAAEITARSGEAGGYVTLAEGKLGDAITGYMESVVGGINALVEEIGAGAFGSDLLDLAGIELRIREETVSVLINGIESQFKDMEEAINFAVIQAIKTAEFDNLSPEVESFLRHSRNTRDAEEFAEGLQFAQDLRDLRITQEIGELGFSMRQTAEQFQLARNRATEFGISLDALFTEQFNQLQDLRDQITGVDSGLSEREQRERDAERFNIEISRMRAEAEAELEGLLSTLGDQQRRLDITATGEAFEGLFDTLSQGAGKIDGEGLFGGLMGGGGTGFRAGLAQNFADTQQRINELQTLLGGLPDLIDPEEIKVDERREDRERQREERRRIREQREADFNATLDRLRDQSLSGFELELRDLDRLMESMSETANDLGLSMDEAAELITQAQDEVLSNARQGALTSGTQLLIDALNFIGEEEEARRLARDLAIAELDIRERMLRIEYEKLGLNTESLDRVRDIVNQLTYAADYIENVGRRIGAVGGEGGAGGAAGDAHNPPPPAPTPSPGPTGSTQGQVDESALREAERAMAGIADLRDSLLITGASTFAPRIQLQNTLSAFEAISAQVLGGDASQLGELESMAQNLLDLNRDVFGSGGGGQGIVELVLDVLSSVTGGALNFNPTTGEVSITPGDPEDRTLEVTEMTLTEMQSQSDLLRQILDALVLQHGQRAGAM